MNVLDIWMNGIFGDTDDFRFSLAGAQEKTALLWHEGAWHIPLGATPTTHIFKLPLGLAGNTRYDLQHSVENEWLSMELLRTMGCHHISSTNRMAGRACQTS